VSLLSQARDSSELIRNLTAREVKGKYKSTALGQLWSLVTPVATMIVYTLVFSFIIRMQPDPGDPSGLKTFPLWLMCALLPWTFFTAVVNSGISSLVNNDNLIKKVYFPRWTLPLSATLAALRQWGIEMLLLAVALSGALLVWGRTMVLPWLPLVLLVMVLFALFALGLALVLAITNVYFRDTQHFVTIVLQMWFYLTPIIYPAKYVKEQLAKTFPDPSPAATTTPAATTGPCAEPAVPDPSGTADLLFGVYSHANPVYPFMEAFRNLLYDNRMPALGLVAECAAWAAVSIGLGIWIFQRHQGRLAEAL